jgi:hypothetical protein
VHLTLKQAEAIFKKPRTYLTFIRCTPEHFEQRRLEREAALTADA